MLSSLSPMLLLLVLLSRQYTRLVTTVKAQTRRKENVVMKYLFEEFANWNPAVAASSGAASARAKVAVRLAKFLEFG